MADETGIDQGLHVAKHSEPGETNEAERDAVAADVCRSLRRVVDEGGDETTNDAKQVA